MPISKSGPNKDPGRPANQKHGKPTLDDILGRAKNTLDQSRQFRNASEVKSRHLPSTNVAPASSVSTKNLPEDIGLGTNLQLRKPGPAPFSLSYKKPKNYESSDSDISRREAIGLSSDHRRNSSPSGSSRSSISTGKDSDSTITPPTITDTPVSSKSRSQRKVTYNDQVLDGMPLSDAARRNSINSLSYSKSKGNNLLERTLLLRGDPVSNESYAVLKAMMFEKEHREVEQSYTEDFASEAVSTLKSESLEVPRTETVVDQTEVPLEDSSENVTMRDTQSSLLVEEIVENLQDLAVSSYSNSQSELENDEDKEIPSMDDQIALADLEAIIRDSSSEPDKLMSIHDNHNSVSTVQSKALSGSSKASGTHSIDDKSSTGSKKSFKEQGSSKTASNSRASIVTSDRISSRKSFQRVLSKVKFQEADKKLVDYVPPVTKPQRKIQYILEKEVYQKELKRIRSVQKQEESLQRKIEETKTLNLGAIHKGQKSGMKYKEPSFSKLLLPELINDRNDPFAATDKNPLSNLGAPYFNRNGSLGMDYSIENYPRTPDENFNTKTPKMDIPQLVREVLASNERMYQMTVDASQEMGRQYGKNAKLLLKMKNREVQKKNNTRK